MTLFRKRQKQKRKNSKGIFVPVLAWRVKEPFCQRVFIDSAEKRTLWKYYRGVVFDRKIWTVAQIQKLHDLQENYIIPQTVVNEIERITKILDSRYGSGRDVDNEGGGYIILVIPDTIGDGKPAYLDVLGQNCLCPDRE